MKHTKKILSESQNNERDCKPLEKQVKSKETIDIQTHVFSVNPKTGHLNTSALQSKEPVENSQKWL